MTARERLIFALAVLLGVYCVGVIGYIVIGELTDVSVTLLDAVYMVAITLSTVGYREIITPTPPMEAWTIIIIVFGVIAAMVALSSVTTLFVEGEVGRMIGSRKLESRIKHLSGHVIICGFGRMGQLLTERLMERHVPLVVLEEDLSRCRLIEGLGALYIVGDAADEKTLEQAGIPRARSLVSVLASDADNVFVALTAREMRPDLQIIARAEQPMSEAKLRRAGADRVISIQSIGADRIANVLTRPHLADFVDVASRGVELEMGQFVVSGDAWIAGKTLRESNIRQAADVMVVAIRRTDGESCFNPGANETIHAGDALITIGPAGAVARLEDMNIAQPEPGE